MTPPRPDSPALRALLATFAAALRPPPNLTVSEWAERHRVLDSSTSAEPGPWRNARTPYLAAIMDALSPQDPCQIVVFMKGAQVGATEAGNNWLGYCMHHDPGPILAVQSTVEMAEDWSRRRLDCLVDTTPALRGIVAPKKSRDARNTLAFKEFRGGSIAIRGANSPAGFRSNPIRFVMFDEVDSYDQSVGIEGSPIKLGEQRTATFRNRKILKISTPLDKSTSHIAPSYERSDKRRFMVPCPHCGVFQALEWERVKWSPGQHAQAHYECDGCKERIDNHRKPWMLARGVWQATAPGDGGRTVGFHLSSLYSPWTSWGELATEWVEAQGDQALLKTFVNLKLGQTWDDETHGAAPDPASLEGRVEDYAEGTCPPGVAVLTAGVDVQDDRIELEIVGWGAGEESWSVLHRSLDGDPASDALWEDLDDILDEALPHPTLGSLRVEGTAIDTGGHHTAAVLRYCGRHAKKRRWAIKGRSGKEPIWRVSRGRRRKTSGALHMVGVDSIKQQTYSRLRKPEVGPGYCHFPKGRSAEWFAQLTAEHLKTTYHAGRATTRWVLPEHRANEALDCRVYATAALHGWYAQGKRLERAVAALAVAAKNVPGAVTPEAPAEEAPRRAALPPKRVKRW